MSFVNLNKGDWIIQNCANSAVGRWVIFIAKKLGLKTVNIVRDPSQVATLLDLGADEYLTKPFAPDELEACIRSLLTRSRKRNDFNPLVIQVGDLKLDIIKKHVFKGSKLIRLTLIEFNLLRLLVDKAGEILTRTAILDCIWGYTSYRYIDTRVVDVYVHRLRSKLEQDLSTPNLILTIRGKGYMFQIVGS